MTGIAVSLEPPVISSVIALGAWVFVFLKSMRDLRRFPRLGLLRKEADETGGEEESRPEVISAVAVIVPARNEVEVISDSVLSILAQGTRVGRLIVVDDGSTDGTTERLVELAREHPSVEVIRGRGLRPGECGKPAALEHAYTVARPSDEWLLFLDADVVLAEGALAALTDAQSACQADLVSVIPRMRMVTSLEKLVLPLVGAIVLGRFPPHRVAAAGDPLAFANGQLILVRRAIYEAAGGHLSVVSEILEDVRLAERIKSLGGRLLLADGRAIASTRMYDGWAEIVEGWSKNLFLLFGSRVATTLRWIAMACALAWIGPLLAMWAGWPVGILTYVGISILQMTLRARGGAAPIWAVFAPLSVLLVSWIALRSMWLHRSDALVPWKGRFYSRSARPGGGGRRDP